MPSYSERLGGRVVCLLRRGVASSEKEIGYLLEGRSATLERGGDCPADPRGTLERGGDRSVGSRGMQMGRTLGFFESFPFFRMGSRPWAFVGLVALTRVCVF